MGEPAGPRRARWARWAVAAWLLGCTALFTWPVVRAPTQRIIGGEYAGAWRTLWAHDWTLRRLLQDGAWPLDAPEIAFPRGGPFSSIAPVNDLLSLLPHILFGLVPAYNMVVWFHMLLASSGGYALGRVAGLRRGGALVSAMVFGFNGFLLSYGISAAVVETSTVGWLAWFLAAMLWLVRDPGLRPAVATGLAFAMAGLSSFYWAVIIALLTPVIAIPALRDRVVAGAPRRRLMIWVLASIGVALVVFGPPASALMATYLEQGSVLQDYADRKQSLLSADVMAGLAHDYATAAGYLMPGKDRLVVHEDMDRLVQSTYAGWVALSLAVIGVGRGRLRWAAVGLCGGLLSLGPFVFLSVSSWRPEAVWWWVALREVVPPVRMITSYVRFSAFFFLGLAVLAGAGADRIAAGVSLPWLRAFVGPVFGALVIAEMFVISPVPAPVSWAEAWVPAASDALADLPIAGAVLDWPQRYPYRSVEVSRYFYYQSRHKRPIPYDFAPTSYMPGPIEGNAFFARLERLTYGAEYDSGAWTAGTELPLRLAARELQEMGFAYVVLHPWQVEGRRRALITGWLDSLLTRAATMEDGGIIWSLELDEVSAGGVFIE